MSADPTGTHSDPRTANEAGWHVANQRCLAAEIAVVRARIASHFDLRSESIASTESRLASARQELTEPYTLDRLADAFELSRFERGILVLTAAPELEGSFGDFLAALPGSNGSARVTFSLALASLPEPRWSALSSARPLRYWHLIAPTPGAETLVHAPLRLEERILHFLTGTSAIDRRLEDYVDRVAFEGPLPPSHEKLADDLVRTWSDAGEVWPVLQLVGVDPSSHRSIAARVAHRLGMQLHRVDARDVPTAPAERRAWFRLWEREAILTDSTLLVECDDHAGPEIVRAVQGAPGAVVASAREALALAPRSSLRFDVARPTHAEQKVLWLHALGECAGACNGQIDAVVAQFDLPAEAVAVTGRLAHAQFKRAKPEHDPIAPSPQLWDLCRSQVALRLGELAQRIERRATWNDLVLPESAITILRTLTAQVRQRTRVCQTWGFARRSDRGLGLGALFAGPSGTGKTMAAEVLAGELGLDLFRIDLSAVVSKYIGETEKNLRRVFDAAESGGAVLLFDEADALFGRRSEIKDSHDRYANIEVSYLLQRMEAYRGLAILTTNLKQALDVAFVRRLRFIVPFTHPDARLRERIWRSIFPPETPLDGLDFTRLAALDVTGGSIRNIALNAAFLAADADEPVRMRHLLAATEAEAAKLERPLIDREIAGWV